MPLSDNEMRLKLMRNILALSFQNNLPLTLKGGTALLFGYGLIECQPI